LRWKVQIIFNAAEVEQGSFAMQKLEPLPIECRSEAGSPGGTPAQRRETLPTDYPESGSLGTPARAKRRRLGAHPSTLDVYPVTARRRECQELDGFFDAALRGDKSAPRCLYITGMPGTGKTKSVRAAATAWRSKNPLTTVIEVNCMGLTQKTVTGVKSFLEEHCARTMEGRPTDARRRSPGFLSRLTQRGGPTIIIADEVDQLLRKGGIHSECQADPGAEAMKWLMTLPTTLGEGPEMAVVLIANSIDLLERLPTYTRCESLLFEAYSVDQLREILTAEATVQGLAVNSSAVEICVRRVAAQSGDCRQAIRFLEEYALQETEVLVMQDENLEKQAIPIQSRKPRQGLSRPNPLASVVTLPLEQQILLSALASLKAECTSVTELLRHHKQLCQVLKQRADLSSKSQVATALTALEQRGLVAMRATRSAKSGSRVLQPHQLRDSFVELTVTCSTMRETVCKANPLLTRCFDQ